MITIPKLKVYGNNYQCGVQIGQQVSHIVNEYINLCRQNPPESISWQDCLKLTPQYLEPTEKYFPEIVAETRGVADGAKVDFVELFASGIEEFYTSVFKGCTDIVVLPPASQHTLIAHNNDLSKKMLNYLTQVEYHFNDGSKLLTIGLAGYGVSVGVNSYGVILTGNELTQNDEKFGIPRAFIARAILTAKNFDEALKIATHSERASSYNNIITVAGKSASVEASATDHELIYPTDGVLVHSNHFCTPKMSKFEGKPNYTSSINRLNDAKHLAQNFSKPITIDNLKSILRNHGSENIGNDNTVCRHGASSESVFGIVVDANEMKIETIFGNPCQNEFDPIIQI